MNYREFSKMYSEMAGNYTNRYQRFVFKSFKPVAWLIAKVSYRLMLGNLERSGL